MNQYMLGELPYMAQTSHNVLWLVVSQEGVWRKSALFFWLNV